MNFKKVWVSGWIASLLITILICSTIFAPAVYPPNIYLDDIPSSQTYDINTDGTNYWATRYDGKILYPSTNASNVCEQVWGDDRLIHFKAGTYSIDYDVLSTYQNFIVEGEGAGNTILEIGANGGFTLSKGVGASFRYNIEFRDLTFDGQNVAQYGIRSRSDAGGGSGNVILPNFDVHDCWFTGFNDTDAHALDMVGLEGSYIQKNYFWGGTTGSMIYLWEDGTYECGNIHIAFNDIDTAHSGGSGTCGILINSTGTDEDSGVGNVYVTNNKFLGDSSNSVAVKSVVHEDLASRNRSGGGHKILGNRMESTNIVEFVDETSRCAHTKNNIANNEMVFNAPNGESNIILGTWTWNTEVHDNYLSNFNSASYFVKDQCNTTTGAHNRIVDNNFYGSAMVDLGFYTEVRGNKGLNPLGVQSTAYRSSAVAFSYYGLYNNWENETVYTIYNSDMLLTLTGGSDINITIWDLDDNLVAINMTSASAKLIPLNYQFSINCTTTPNSIFAWT